MKKHRRLLALLMVFLLSLGSFAGTAIAEEEDKTVTIALAENIFNLDPVNGTGMPFFITMKNCMEGLVYSNHDGTYEPLLATSWEVSEDGLSWTFHLREGVKFHNGEDFTSADVVGVFNRILENGTSMNLYPQYWADLESVEAPDDYTVILHTKVPMAYLLLSASQTLFYGDEAWAEYGERLFSEQKIWGTGPWVFQEWIDSQYTKYIKNPDYWGKDFYDPYYETFYLRYVLEPSTAVAGHLAGDIDAYLAAGGISADMLPLYVGSEDRIDLVRQETGSYQFWGLNCAEDSPFHDINVRKAFSLAIDRQAIADSIYGGNAVPLKSLMCMSIGWDPTLPDPEYNPELAKELLANSSYNGEVIELSSHTSTLKAEDSCLAVADMLAQVGFNCTINVVENVVLTEMRSTGNYDAYMVTVMHEGADPSSLMTQRVMLDAHKSSYINEELNATIAAGNAEFDPEKRQELWEEANQIMLDEYAPHIPYLQLICTYAIDKGVTGLGMYPDGLLGTDRVDYDPSLAA